MEALYIGFRMDFYIYLKMVIIYCHVFAFIKNIKWVSYTFIGSNVISICEKSFDLARIRTFRT